MLVSSEYSTGMIRATLTAVPRRLPVLWAKSGVFTAVTLVSMTLASFAAYLGGMSLLSSHHLQTSLSAPGVTRAVIGAALYLTVVGLLGGRSARCSVTPPGRSPCWWPAAAGAGLR